MANLKRADFHIRFDAHIERLQNGDLSKLDELLDDAEAVYLEACFGRHTRDAVCYLCSNLRPFWAEARNAS